MEMVKVGQFLFENGSCENIQHCQILTVGGKRVQVKSVLRHVELGPKGGKKRARFGYLLDRCAYQCHNSPTRPITLRLK